MTVFKLYKTKRCLDFLINYAMIAKPSAQEYFKRSTLEKGTQVYYSAPDGAADSAKTVCADINTIGCVTKIHYANKASKRKRTEENATSRY